MFRLNGAFEIRPDLGVLCRVDGEEIDLRPKTFQTLLFLVRNRHRLVTKDELVAQVWDAAVTDDTLVQSVVELRKALGDAAREPRFIKTVPKLGYRFVGPVEEVAEPLPPRAREPESVAAAPVVTAGRQFRIGPASIAITAALLLAAALLKNFDAGTETAALDPATGKPGIAVMFLDNQSGAEDADWMRQGLAEMLITGLSRSNRVNVLGRKHLQTLLDRAGHDSDSEISLAVARDVARRVQAQYLLMGSFARLGDTTRVDVRIEHLDGKQVASETLTFDRPERALTEIDLLAWKLARYFDSGVERPAGVAASGLTIDLHAYRAYTLGVSKAIAYHSAEAIEMFEDALELDPNFVMARARLGYVYGVTWPQANRALVHLEAAFKQADRLRESDRLYIEAWYAIAQRDFPGAIVPLQRLVRLYPYEVEAYDRLTRLLEGERRVDEAIDVARRGLLIDPESPDLHNSLGGAYLSAGRYADAIAVRRRYVALAPTEPNSYDSLGLSMQTAGRYAEAEEMFEQALALKPDFDVALAHLANVHFHTGRYRSAEKLYARYVELGKSATERARGYHAIATIGARQGRLTDAAEAAVAVDRENSRVDAEVPRWGMLHLQALTGQPLQAMPSREEYAAISARGSRLSRRLFLWLAGRDALARGNVSAGLDVMRQVLLENSIYWSIDPVEDALAMTYFELGRWDDAIAEYGRLLRANPQYPRAHYYLALAYDKKGERASARDALQQFLTLWSKADDDIPEVVDAKARLARLQR